MTPKKTAPAYQLNKYVGELFSESLIMSSAEWKGSFRAALICWVITKLGRGAESLLSSIQKDEMHMWSS